MSFSHGTRARVVIGGAHLSGFATEAGEEYQGDVEESTVLLDEAKTYIPGLSDGSLSLAGLFDGTADAIHQVLAPLRALQDPTPYSYAPRGFGLGEPVAVTDVLVTAYQVSASVASITQADVSGQATGGIEDGLSLHDLTVLVEDSDEGDDIDHGAATTGGGIAHLHVLHVDGTSPELDVTIEHSADGDVWVDLVVFAQADDVGSERVEVAGTVNRFLRAVWDVDGTSPEFRFVVAFARR